LKVQGCKLRVFEVLGGGGGISKRVEVLGGSLKFPLFFFEIFAFMQCTFIHSSVTKFDALEKVRQLRQLVRIECGGWKNLLLSFNASDTSQLPFLSCFFINR
jgi:hypothetical protein